MRFSIHPLILYGALSGLVALIAACLAWRASRKWVQITCAIAAWFFMLPVFVVCVAFHPELIDARFRTFKRFYGDLYGGMTRQEVFAAMDRRYPAGGPRLRPTTMEDTPEILGFFMNPEPPEREPNCEGIFLTMRDGRVVNKAYGED